MNRESNENIRIRARERQIHYIRSQHDDQAMADREIANHLFKAMLADKVREANEYHMTIESMEPSKRV